MSRKHRTDPAAAAAATERLFAEAAAHFEAGRLGEAERILAKVQKRAKDIPEVLHLLAMIALKTDRAGKAVGHLKKAIAKQPSAALYNLLGGALRRTGRIDDAVAAYERAAALDPGLADAPYNLANALRESGRAEDAVPHYRRAVALEPDFVDAHYNLGLALKESGRLEEAVAVNRTVLALAPGDADARLNLANVLKDLGRMDEASEIYRELIALTPGNADIHCNLAHAQYELGDVEDAAAGFARALEIDPDHVPSLRSLGHYHRELGRFREAEDCYRKIVALAPDDPQGLMDIVGVKTFSADDPDLQKLRDFLNRPDLDEADERSLHFNLAKALDDIGEADEAFRHLARGNAMMREARDADVPGEIAQMTRIAQVFQPAFLADRRAAGCSSSLPIFIVGMPRSGTTLTEQVLASHPDVLGGGESPHLVKVADTLRRVDDPEAHYPDWVPDVAPEVFAKIGETHVETLSRHLRGQRHVTDKMPANFRHLGLIRIALPDAKVIHCMRDPVATCFSCYQQEFEQALDYSWDLQDLGRYYRAYHGLMAHWREALGEWVLDVRYEDLVGDLEAQARRILEFCGLEWDDACLQPHRTERRVLTSSQAQVRRPIYRSSVARWKAYEKHLGPLIAALGPLADGA